jgi:hypothetical protein
MHFSHASTTYSSAVTHGFAVIRRQMPTQMQVCTEVKQRCAEALKQNEQALREAIPERENSLSPDMEKATAVARAAAAAKYNEEDASGPTISYVSFSLSSMPVGLFCSFHRVVIKKQQW